MPTRQEIEQLKKEWLNDAVWDIEDTEGFEEHRAELLSFRLETEAEWKSQEEEKRLNNIEKARRLGVEGLYDLYVRQQAQIESLTNALLLLTEGQSHEAYKAISNRNYK